MIMPSNACVVKVNGYDYFCPCDRVDDIAYIDNFLVNTSNSSITLYTSFVEPNDYSTGYPRIIISSLSKAVYRANYNSSSNVQPMNVSSYEVVNRNFALSFILSLVILGVLICQLFKR